MHSRARPSVLVLTVALVPLACGGSEVDDAPSAPAEAAGAPSDEATGSALPVPAGEDAGSDAIEPSPVAPELPVVERDPNEPPPDYGAFRFPNPPASEEELSLFGLAGYEVVAVYGGPSRDSTKLGFLRIGARMRVGEKIVTEDCSKGWHPLEGGGYACAKRGLVVDKRDPYMSYRPAEAALDQPFPYSWAYVHKWNAPMWWRVPTDEEVVETRSRRELLEAERTGEPPPGAAPAPAAAASQTPPAGSDPLPAVDDPEDPPAGGSADPSPAGDPQPASDPDPGEDSAPADAPPDAAPAPDAGDPVAEEEPPEPINLPLSLAHPWLEKGFFISVGETVREGGRGYWRTARGGIVSKADAYAYKPKDYQGHELTASMSFPVGFVMAKKGTKLLRLDDDDKLRATGKTLEKRTFLDLGEEVEINGKTYFTVQPLTEAGSGAEAGNEAGAEAGNEAGNEAGAEAGSEAERETLLVKADVMRLADLQPIPKGLETWDRWIDVDLSKQILVAYQGSRPVYVTLVSTGKKGDKEEPFETPTGRWRIYSKQVTSNMDGTTATDGNYAIQDVPWVMYFDGSYALHGAFWHRSFGYVRSHGCVNLGPSDARWLFGWTTPALPEGWHGVRASDENPGTTVVVRRSQPD